jgi:hypothetical protein
LEASASDLSSLTGIDFLMTSTVNVGSSIRQIELFPPRLGKLRLTHDKKERENTFLGMEYWTHTWRDCDGMLDDERLVDEPAEGLVLYTSKTAPGLRMPMAEEWERSESQSVFGVDEEELVLCELLFWDPDMVKLREETF